MVERIARVIGAKSNNVFTPTLAIGCQARSKRGGVRRESQFDVLRPQLRQTIVERLGAGAAGVAGYLDARALISCPLRELLQPDWISNAYIRIIEELGGSRLEQELDSQAFLRKPEVDDARERL